MARQKINEPRYALKTQGELDAEKKAAEQRVQTIVNESKEKILGSVMFLPEEKIEEITFPADPLG